MHNSSRILAAVAAATALAFGGAAVAQNTGSTPAGASTSSGAGITTSGTAAPAGQTPRATDSTLGKGPGQPTGAGMGNTAAGASPGKTADKPQAKAGSKVAAKDRKASKKKKKTTVAAKG